MRLIPSQIATALTRWGFLARQVQGLPVRVCAPAPPERNVNPVAHLWVKEESNGELRARPEVSVVIPCLNEEGSVGSLH